MAELRLDVLDHLDGITLDVNITTVGYHAARNGC